MFPLFGFSGSQISYVIGIIVGLVFVGLPLIWLFFQLRKPKLIFNARIREFILKRIHNGETITIPLMLQELNLPSTFSNKGKIAAVLGKLCNEGVVEEIEPPGTTFKNRLNVLSFKLKIKSSDN